MKALPGVRDVSVVSNVPLTDFDIESSFQIEGRAPYKPGEEAVADYTVAGTSPWPRFYGSRHSEFASSDSCQQCFRYALLSR